MSTQREFNFVVKNDFLEPNKDLLEPIFDGDPVTFVSDETDMFDLLVESGVFPSKGQARKNWQKTGRDIPDGFSHFQGLGKLRREIAVWKPVG